MTPRSLCELSVLARPQLFQPGRLIPREDFAISSGVQGIRTASPESVLPPFSSSWARIRPCSIRGPAHPRQPPISSMPRVRRGPASVSFLGSLSNTANATFAMRMDVRRRRLRRARDPIPRATCLFSLPAVVAAAATDIRTAAGAACRWVSAGWGQTSMYEEQISIEIVLDDGGWPARRRDRRKLGDACRR